MKLRATLSMCLLLGSSLALAQPAAGGSAPPQGGPMPGNESALPPLDLNPAFDGMDTNHDGVVSKDEWFDSGMSQMSYEGLFQVMLDRDRSGDLSREEMTSSQPLFQVDTDGDGKASTEEFVAANNAAGERRKAEMEAGAGAPPQTPPDH